LGCAIVESIVASLPKLVVDVSVSTTSWLLVAPLAVGGAVRVFAAVEISVIADLREFNNTVSTSRRVWISTRFLQSTVRVAMRAPGSIQLTIIAFLRIFSNSVPAGAFIPGAIITASSSWSVVDSIIAFLSRFDYAI